MINRLVQDAPLAILIMILLMSVEYVTTIARKWMQKLDEIATSQASKIKRMCYNYWPFAISIKCLVVTWADFFPSSSILLHHCGLGEAVAKIFRSIKCSKSNGGFTTTYFTIRKLRVGYFMKVA